MALRLRCLKHPENSSHHCKRRMSTAHSKAFTRIDREQWTIMWAKTLSLHPLCKLLVETRSVLGFYCPASLNRQISLLDTSRCAFICRGRRRTSNMNDTLVRIKLFSISKNVLLDIAINIVYWSIVSKLFSLYIQRLGFTQQKQHVKANAQFINYSEPYNCSGPENRKYSKLSHCHNFIPCNQNWF